MIIFLKYFQFQFQNKLQIVLFICAQTGLCLKKYVTLLRNVICYISFHLASKFNTDINKNSLTSDSVLRLLPGLRPWAHWGTWVISYYLLKRITTPT